MRKRFCVMMVLTAASISFASASEPKGEDASGNCLPPKAKDRLVETMLEWRAWYRDVLKDTVPTKIESVRIAGPFPQAFNAREKALSAWTEQDFQNARIHDHRSTRSMYVGGRLSLFHFVAQIEVKADRAGQALLVLQLGPEIELRPERADAPTIPVWPLYESSIRHWLAPTVQEHMFLALVPVQAGANRFRVSFGNSDAQRMPERDWHVFLGEGIEHGLWKKTRQFFSRRDYPLIEAVDRSWVAWRQSQVETPLGWFRGKGTELETAMVASCVKDLGTDPGAAHLTEALARLSSGNPLDQDPRWLRLAVAAAAYRQAVRQFEQSTMLLEHLDRAYPGRYPADQARSALAGLRERTGKRMANAMTEKACPVDFNDIEAFQRDWLVRKHPQLKGQRILYLKREPYASFHIYDFFQDGLDWRNMGADLCLLDVDTGKVLSILPEALRGGWIDQFDLDFDARRIVLSYIAPKSNFFGLWELNLDDNSLRQLSGGPEDPIRKTYFGHKNEGDIHPCYLPDGGIAFASTRLGHSVLCNWGIKVTNIHRMNRDGSNLRPLGFGSVSEFSPAVMADGRLMYNRWEYVYKNVFDGHNLWSMRPDGTANESVYGNLIAVPGNIIYPRQIPDRPDLIVAVGCGHTADSNGAIGIVHRRRDKLSTEAWQSLTPECTPTDGTVMVTLNGQQTRHQYGPRFTEPWPLDADTFLVSYNREKAVYETDAFGLALLDTFGNRIPLHTEPDGSCWNPMVFAPRPRPPLLPTTADPGNPNRPGIMFMSDVYQGLGDIRRGTIKYLRVLDYVPRPHPASLHGSSSPGHDKMSAGAALWPAALHGIVPVEADGSATFELPPGRALFFQVLDKDYKSMHTMRTHISMQPGEVRSCIGCHESRSMTSASAALPLARTPRPLQFQPGDTGPRVIDYAADIQPILERHCVACHKPGGKAAKLDLAGTADGVYSVSCRNLMNSGAISFIYEFYQPSGGKPLPNKIYGESSQRNRDVALPVKSWGSHASKLTTMLEQGHGEVRLSQEEMIRIITWLDTGSQFYGTYLGAIRKAGDKGPVKYYLSPEYLVPPPFNAAMDPLGYMADNPDLYPSARRR